MTWGARGLSVPARRASSPPLLADIDLDLPASHVTAIVGGDGAGKSTLLRALLGRVPISHGTVTMPDLRQVGYQPSSSGVWPTLTVAQNIEFVAESYRMPPARARARGDQLLDRAALTQACDRLAGQLSGGMRQKLGFCLAMLHEPDVLLLDEPSTGVDPVSRVELWKLIVEAAAAGTAVAMTTTYLDEAERAPNILVLDSGRVMAAGSADDICAATPGHVILRPPGATDGRETQWRRGAQIHQWMPGGVDPVGDGEPLDLDLEDAVIVLGLDSEARRAPEPGQIDTPWAGPPLRRNTDTTPLIEVESATQRFGDVTAVDGVSLSVRPGEIVGLLGANGAGKTTLIRMILGLDAPVSGRLTLLGEPPARANRHDFGYVPQRLGLFVDLTVAENIEFVAEVFGVPRPLPELPMSLGAVHGELVGGIGLGRQRQLAFYCALLHAPRLLILDEPTSGVDPLARARLWDVIHAQADAGTGIVVTTHYMQEAEQCDRLQIMAHGMTVAAGTTSEIIEGYHAVVVEATRWPEAFAALADAGLPVVLAGRSIRVAGTDRLSVEEVVANAGVQAVSHVVPATLEETMALIDRRVMADRRAARG